MGMIAPLRRLWRLRSLVAVAGVVALLVGLSVAYRIHPPFSLQSRQYHVGIASAQALVDTPSSQIVDLGGGATATADIATLSARASLLASLMATSPMKDEIARSVGVAPNRLIAVPPASAVPGATTTPTAPVGSTVSLKDPRANILKTSIPELQSGQIPIIAIDTQAPDPRTAARLADEAIVVLQRHLASVAGLDNVPLRHRVVIRELGPAQASAQSRGPGKKLAIIAFLFVFVAGCGAILGLMALIGGWRQADELEREPVLDLDVPLEPEPPAFELVPDGADHRPSTHPAETWSTS